MTVPNWRTSLREKIVYISPDGIPYNLHDTAKMAVLSMTGWGMPPAAFADARGPFQHGSNLLSVRIPPREVVLTLRYSGCSRSEYLTSRKELVNALRTNRTNVNNPTPGNLRWYRADGTIYQLDVVVSSGPNFSPVQSGWDEFGYTDEIQFIAHNPIIYDPRLNTDIFSDLGCTPESTWQLPFLFGIVSIVFNVDICNSINDITVDYQGTWQTFPLITINGPATDFTITHLQTGLKISLYGYSIANGDSAVFDLTYGTKTATLTSTGESLLKYVSIDSDLGSFAIEPIPVVDNGLNTFEVSITNGSGNTQVVFQYYERHIGV